MKMANPSSPLTIVPTSDSCGRSGSRRFDGGGATTAGWAATALGGGRREGEKIGRSLVTVNLVNGIAHSGLALKVCCGGGADRGGVTTRTGAAVSMGIAEDAGASRLRPLSGTSSDRSVDVAE